MFAGGFDAMRGRGMYRLIRQAWAAGQTRGGCAAATERWSRATLAVCVAVLMGMPLARANEAVPPEAPPNSPNDPHYRMPQWRGLTVEALSNLVIDNLRRGQIDDIGFVRDLAKKYFPQYPFQELSPRADADIYPGFLVYVPGFYPKTLYFFRCALASAKKTCNNEYGIDIGIESKSAPRTAYIGFGGVFGLDGHVFTEFDQRLAAQYRRAGPYQWAPLPGKGPFVAPHIGLEVSQTALYRQSHRPTGVTKAVYILRSDTWCVLADLDWEFDVLQIIQIPSSSPQSVPCQR
jgi:hypothetical protein